jgi:hypothetical protein
MGLSALIRACQPEPGRRLVIRGKIIPLAPLRSPVKFIADLAAALLRQVYSWFPAV